jgi:hypothetical protein
MICRNCETTLTLELINLGFSPPSNAYLTPEDLNKVEIWVPLRVFVCQNCWLVQTLDFHGESDVFTENYAYFSSTSVSWVEHARSFVEKSITDLGLGANSFVIEVASNDGYLLQHFKKRGIPHLGIEPTRSTAQAAISKGIDTVIEFLNPETANEVLSRYQKADLLIGNNVFAHVPDIRGFTDSLALLLSEDGTLVLEFPHLLKLLQENSFDTIYHEHFSYLSLHSSIDVLKRSGLQIWKVEELSTHGGSLRIYASPISSRHDVDDSVIELLQVERDFGLTSATAYTKLDISANQLRDDVLDFLISCRKQGLKVAAYGAAAKGNTLLNFAGVKSNLIQMVCDLAPSKQGNYLPGSHIPIVSMDDLRAFSPDVVVILPWNLSREILAVLRENLGQLPKVVRFSPHIQEL